MNQKLIKTESYQEYNIVSSAMTSEYAKHIRDCDKNVVFFDGETGQWTQDELDAMNDRGQYILTLNATRKAVLGMVGLFTSSKPKFRCDPVGRTDNAIAGISSALIDYTYRISRGQYKIPEILLNAFKANIDYAVVRSIGNEKVIFESASYRDIIVSNSKDAMFRDAEWIAYKNWVPIEKIKVLYGVEPTSYTFPSEWISWDKTYVGSTNKLQLFDSTRKYALVFERYVKFNEKTENGIRTRIKKRTLIGYEHVYEEILPSQISEYPIIPMYSDFSNNQFKFGEVHFLRDPQRFINKMFNETIRSAQALSSGKVVVRKNEIPGGDPDQFAANWSLPGAVVVMQPGSLTPTIVNPTPINGAYFEMFQNAHMMFGTMNLSGDAAKFNEIATDPARKQEWDSMISASLRIPATIFESFLSQLGRVVLQFHQAYTSNDMIVKILDAMDCIKTVEKAQQDKLDASTTEGIELWSKAMEEKGMSLEEIDDRVYEAKYAIEKMDAVYDFLKDPDILDVDVQVEADSYTSTNAMNKFKMMYQLAEKGLIPPELLTDYLPVEDKEAVKIKINRMRSASRQVDQLNKQLEVVSKENEKLQQEMRKLKDKSIDIERQVGHDYQAKDAMLKKLRTKIMDSANSRITSAEQRLEFKELLLDLKKEIEDNPEIVKNYLTQYLGE